MISTIFCLYTCIQRHLGQASKAVTQAYKKNAVALMIQEFFMWFAVFFRMHFEGFA